MSDLGKNSLNDCGCDNADGEKPVRRHRPGLLPKIIIAIALGIGAGYVCPLWCARLMATFNAVFSQFLGFCIPLIILGFVAPAIADIGARAGKMLVATALLAYVFTLFAGFLSYATGMMFFPSMISAEEYVAETSHAVSIAQIGRAHV